MLAEDVKAHSEKLERERRQNEALASRLADMEATALRRETDMSELKRLLQVVKEEHQQVMQVYEMQKEEPRFSQWQLSKRRQERTTHTVHSSRRGRTL